MNIIDSLPAIGTFLAGPAGGLAASGIAFLAEKFGASAKTVDSVKEALVGLKPEDVLKAKQIDIEFQKFCLENDIKLQLAQIGVNTEEAKSANWLVSGWRPACGWIGAFSLGYAAILEPLARFVAKVGFGYAGSFPVLDSTITMQVLFGILGLGAYRSFDKQKGTA